jgi:hypothetical protein
MRNGKLMLACAETVEDETSLWKGKEKEVEKLQTGDFAEMLEQLQENICTRLVTISPWEALFSCECTR